MKKFILLLLAVIISHANAFSQTTGDLQGKVMDENGEPLPYANVTLYQKENLIRGTASDFDGLYFLGNIEVGTYDLVVSYVGMPEKRINGIIIKVGQTINYDINYTAEDIAQMPESSDKVVIIMAYKIPLIEMDMTSSGQTLGAEDIKKLATRNISSIKATTAGISQKDEGEATNSNGSRNSNNDIYVDGVRISGNDIPEFNTEEYGNIVENTFLNAKENPLSTFSIDVDNASYSNLRRYLKEMNQLPPNGAVRLEEMINYFDYNYPQPVGEHPFSITTEIGAAPWNKDHQLIHIGLQGKSIDYINLKASNLVFLIDCSGSMEGEKRIELVKKSLNLLVDQLGEKDKISIVVYAGAAGLVLPATSGAEKEKIRTALRKLNAGGSTAGGQGIELAYKIAKENFIAGGNNRVVLATDGDFNVGVSSTDQLVKMIEEKRKDDIYITICGFGMGNFKDDRMEQIAQSGNGNYFYIDNIREAEKVFVREMRANMFTIAKDVKIQIEFNPNLVKAYRLIGYENRLLKKEDFDDDKKDAGELGAGHNVTAIYEIIPATSMSKQSVKNASDLKYQNIVIFENQSDLMTVKFRYKPIKSEESVLMESVLKNGNISANTSESFRFSAAVIGFGMLLRDSEFKGKANFDLVASLAQSAMGTDPNGDRAEFIQLVRIAQGLKK